MGAFLYVISALLHDIALRFNASITSTTQLTMRTRSSSRAKAGSAAGGALQSAAQSRVPSTAVTGAATINAEKPWVKVQLSDGKQYEVHPDDVDELLRRDPTAKVQ